MKILIVNTLYTPFKVGGAEVSVQMLAEGLVKQGHKVRVLTLHEGVDRKVSVINGVEVVYQRLINFYWPFKNKRPNKILRLLWHCLDTYNPFMAKKFNSELADFKPDVVHTNNLAGFSVAVWDVCKKNKIRIVHTARDYYLFHPNCTLFKNEKNQDFDCLSVKTWSFIKKRKSKNVNYFVGISNYVVNVHKANGMFIDVPACTIYNPVEKIELPATSTFNGNKLRVGYIGALTKEKGFDEFCELVNKYEDMIFIAAGNPKNSRESLLLQEYALNLGVKLIGHVCLEKFLTQVDVVYLPIKWREPFGRTVVECALTGKTVYTNKVGGVTELFSHISNLRLTSSDLVFENSNLTEINNDLFDKTFQRYIKIYRF